MSKTYRNISEAHLNCRRIRYKNQYSQTVYACQELKEEGYNPRARDKKLGRRGYLNSWDDYSVAAYKEATPIEKKLRKFLNKKYGFTSREIKVYSNYAKAVITYTHTWRNWNHLDYDHYFKKFEKADKLKKTSRC